MYLNLNFSVKSEIIAEVFDFTERVDCPGQDNTKIKKDIEITYEGNRVQSDNA